MIGLFPSSHKPNIYRMNTDRHPDESRFVSWTTLLAYWSKLAQVAAALPAGECGDRWRRSIAPALGLHAIAMALAEIGHLPPPERPLARDRAAVGIQSHEATLRGVWSAHDLPPRLDELIADARAALETASSS